MKKSIGKEQFMIKLEIKMLNIIKLLILKSLNTKIILKSLFNILKIKNLLKSNQIKFHYKVKRE